MRAGSDRGGRDRAGGRARGGGRAAPPGTGPRGGRPRPLVKICGVTEPRGLAAAIAAGADAIGLNMVPGTRRALEEHEAAALVRPGAAARPRPATARRSWASSPTGTRPRWPRSPPASASTRSSCTAPSRRRRSMRIPLPVIKALHLPPMGEGAQDAAAAAAAVIARAEAYRAKPNLWTILLDTADPSVPGGTGRRAATDVAAAIASRIPVILAGGLDAGQRRRRAAGRARPSASTRRAASSRSGRRSVRHGRPAAQGPVARGPVRQARPGRPARPALVPFGPRPVDPGPPRARRARSLGSRAPVRRPLRARDAHGRAARPGGGLRVDPAPSPRSGRSCGSSAAATSVVPAALYRADRLAAELERRAGRTPGSLRLYLKREDLDHTGAHKINNALGQALLTRRLGKSRVIAETGAGQHGVATATACALLDLECVVYMGAEDIRRQAPNVLRMRALGTEVREVTSGSATLKDAINEAMRDWVTNVATTHYVLGSAVGPHPYPALVRDLQRVIGDEAAVQMRQVEGRLPDVAIACVGGGSNAIGLLARFIGEPAVRLVGVEAAGEGLARQARGGARGRHARACSTARARTCSRTTTARSMEAHSISAGLDYPGIGPQLSALFEAGRLEILAATDEEALDGVRTLTRTEGILPALEPAHAIAALGAWLAGTTALAPLPDDAIVLLGLSGRGDKDLAAIADRLGVRRMSAVARTSPTVGGRAAHRRARSPAPRADGRAALIPYAVAGYPDAAVSERDRAGAHRRRRRPARVRPALLRSARGRRHAPAGQRRRAGARARRSTGRCRSWSGWRAPDPTRPSWPWATSTSCWVAGTGGRSCVASARPGVTGLILADLTPDEGADLQADAAAEGLAIVYLVTPTTTPDRRAFIASRTGGFLYAVSLAGVTGARTSLPPGVGQVPGRGPGRQPGAGRGRLRRLQAGARPPAGAPCGRGHRGERARRRARPRRDRRGPDDDARGVPARGGRAPTVRPVISRPARGRPTPLL